MKGSVYVTVWLVFLWTLVNGDDCVYKECSCNLNMIFCDDKDLKEIPIRVHPSPKWGSLLMDLNLITRIPSGRLPANLGLISFMDNPITTIDDSAFDESADTLETVTFTGALFTRIPDAFLRLNALISLTIYDTNIVDWNVEAMTHIGKTIQSFFVEKCNVAVWPNWIRTFMNLTHISMSVGYLTSVPDEAFDFVVDKLMSVALSNNSLAAVPKALSKLTALTELYLQLNKISDVTWLPKYSNLTTLALYNNSISDADQLGKALLPFAATLNEFDIQSNRLTAVPNVSFLSKIMTLDFSDNRISDPNSGSLPETLFNLHMQSNLLPLIPKVLMKAEVVTDMFLFSNNIKEIRGEDFPQWTVGAELSNNLISELTDKSFPKMCSLEFLHLSQNPIYRISSQAFKNTPQLNELTLQKTKLMRVPLSLASAISLIKVDFTGSVGLVCTCEEKSLGEWMTSFPTKTITGDCGEMDVYNFFVSLSPDCPEL